MDPDARPLASATQLERVRKVGYFIAPTVFTDVRPDSALAQQEVFGPVLAIVTYDTDAEAVELANGTAYGLSGGVFSGDQDRALALARRLRTGMVDVNGGRFNPFAPFGGYKQSGNGRELGQHSLEEFLRSSRCNSDRSFCSLSVEVGSQSVHIPWLATRILVHFFYV